MRTYVLDTSVLLSDPRAVLRFDEHAVVLPVIVITELEGKRNHPELGYFARSALRLLDALRRRHGRLDRPVPLNDAGGTLRVELGGADDGVLPAGMRLGDNDTRILSAAVSLAERGDDVVIISKDLPMRIKAASVGLAAEEYRAQLAADSGYTRMEELRDRQRLGQSVAEGTANTYDRDIQTVRDEIASVNMRIAKAQASEDSRKRVGELRQELKNAAEQMEYLEHGIHLCEEFVRTKARMVTDSINKHFNFVRFMLFRDQINGGLREICEPTIRNKDDEWVEYRSANYAAQVNAKLDIVTTLAKHYGVHLPIIMDQGESVTEPLNVDTQLIRLIVSAEDQAIRVEVKN